MSAVKQPAPKALEPALWESYIEGPRWSLPPAAIDKGVLECNGAIDRVNKAMGWSCGHLRLVYARESHTLVRRTIIFKVEGPWMAVEAFRSATERAIAAANLGL